MGGGAVGDGGEMTPCLGGWVSTCGTESPIFVVQRGSDGRDGGLGVEEALRPDVI